MNRRHWLMGAASGLIGLPQARAVGSPMGIAAGWKCGAQHQVGVLRRTANELCVENVLDVPSRPHAVRLQNNGDVLAVGRRPGDWLLRWPRGGESVVWQWAEPDRCFNGHVLASADGLCLFTTETDLASGQSLIGVRDAASLEKTAEWPTHGVDAHDLVLDGIGALLVANGGVPAQQETGRLKLRLDAMDSSLVRLQTDTGQLMGQWRLTDRRLSLRHLAWHQHDRQGRRCLGIALQAEHADVAARAAAPLLALFEDERLHLAEMPLGVALAGYGGDMACAGSLFAVSCPRADAVALWNADGRWQGLFSQKQACALMTTVDSLGGPVLWSGGQGAVAWHPDRTEALPLAAKPAIQLDNHWSALPPGSAPYFNVIQRKKKHS